MIWIFIVIDVFFSFLSGYNLGRNFLAGNYWSAVLDLLCLAFWMAMFVKDTEEMRISRD